ncbi:hypothetical protein KY289_008128 [Solanum tuberosum]|nr:hypothetical protein KY289_008128 [Solanum tuberosum]
MFYRRRFLTPDKLVNQLKNFSSYFNWKQQEDAHEFLQCFLNQLESCCNNLETKDNIVKETFGGRLVSNRFKNSGLVVQKVDKHVLFPLELDMLLYTNEINNEEMKYDLYAVIVHSEYLISSRHYYSFIRCAPNKWYKFDDKKVVCV